MLDLFVYPEWDEFYLVVCEHCNQILRPHALDEHIGNKHTPSSAITTTNTSSATTTITATTTTTTTSAPTAVVKPSAAVVNSSTVKHNNNSNLNANNNLIVKQINSTVRSSAGANSNVSSKSAQTNNSKLANNASIKATTNNDNNHNSVRAINPVVAPVQYAAVGVPMPRFLPAAVPGQGQGPLLVTATNMQPIRPTNNHQNNNLNNINNNSGSITNNSSTNNNQSTINNNSTTNKRLNGTNVRPYKAKMLCTNQRTAVVAQSNVSKSSSTSVTANNHHNHHHNHSHQPHIQPQFQFQGQTQFAGQNPPFQPSPIHHQLHGHHQLAHQQYQHQLSPHLPTQHTAPVSVTVPPVTNLPGSIPVASPSTASGQNQTEQRQCLDWGGIGFLSFHPRPAAMCSFNQYKRKLLSMPIKTNRRWQNTYDALTDAFLPKDSNQECQSFEM